MKSILIEDDESVWFEKHGFERYYQTDRVEWSCNYGSLCFWFDLVKREGARWNAGWVFCEAGVSIGSVMPIPGDSLERLFSAMLVQIKGLCVNGLKKRAEEALMHGEA